MHTKTAFLLFFACCMGTVHAHNLHVGSNSFYLDNTKRTSPALGVLIGGKTFYGALYSGSAPSETMHVLRAGDKYWLGQNCAAGTYSADGVTPCQDCGIGHYCTGGMARKSCTYGAISCNGTNHSTDPAMPAGAPINKLMSLDEVNTFMPVTEFSADWREISCCYTANMAAHPNYPETLNDVSHACATGTIGPGTYLFTSRYKTSNTAYQDAINGQVGNITTAFLVVFDHPVSYASMHGSNIFQHFIDTEHIAYTKWTFSTTPVDNWYRISKNDTNISNLTDLPTKSALCVFELK